MSEPKTRRVISKPDAHAEVDVGDDVETDTEVRQDRTTCTFPGCGQSILIRNVPRHAASHSEKRMYVRFLSAI